ncbi:MAG: tetratricopeptide repeat protein [Phycisphaerae bacterium]
MLTQALVVASFVLIGQAEPSEASRPPDPRPQAENRPRPEKPPTEAAVPQDAAMGAWLVRLARHQGHLVGRSAPRSASLHVMALLRAAVRVAPDCSDAYYWLYDLEHRMGRQAAAREALDRYVRLTPGDEAARIRDFELELQERQTNEDRAAFVREQLKHKPLPRSFESELHRWLSKHYYERQETGFAAREIEAALRLNPMNVAARELAYEMFGETEPALQRVEMALQLISINPSQANLVWDLAEFLDRLSLHRRAQEWYNRAIALHRRAKAGPIPAEFLHRLAVSYANSGDFEKAKATADEVIAADPSLMTTRLLRAEVLRKLGNTQAAAADIAAVTRYYEARIDEVVSGKRFDEAAEIAWFFCYHAPDAKRALSLSKLAMEDPKPSSLAALAYGYALELNGETEEALKVLKPLCAVDQLAAYEWARIQIEQDHKSAALTALHKAATIQYSGIAYDLISELLRKHGQTPPKPPLRTKVIAALDHFRRDVFDYYRAPEKFLRFTMLPATDAFPSIGPIRVTFRIENIGSFPITFGDGFMARPLVALTAKLGVDDGTTYENYLQVLMNTRPTLLPGDAIEKTVAVDVGPLRQRLIETVARPVPIEMTALFDPVFQMNRLVSGLGTLAAGPVRVVRRPLDLTPEGIAEMLDRVKSAEAADRRLAAEQIGALLATAQTGMSGDVLDAASIDRLHVALSELLSDETWQVRSHALVAAGWSPLDPRVTVAAAPHVRDENAVVRLLAVRLFAEQHGEKFRQVLKQLSKSDPTPFVRMMATSYLPVLTQARAGDPTD